MQKQCKDCSSLFTISPSEEALYSQIELEYPAQCFDCATRQKFAFWPFGKFRKGKSDLSGESFITVLPEPARYPIYTHHEWHSDAWDPVSFGQVYDPSRSFFDQWKELQEKVPRPHQQGERSVGCDWCDDAWGSKNCYLSRSIKDCEDLTYSYRCINVKNSIGMIFCFDSENCYDCINCYKSVNLQSSRNCQSMIDSAYCFDCRNCTNCFMCWGLRNAQYMIRNVQYTKESYAEELKKYNLASRADRAMLDQEFEDHIKNDVHHRENFNIKTEKSEGNYLTNCNEAHNAFHWQESEHVYNCLRGLSCKSCIDLLGTWQEEFCGNNSCCVDGYKLKYSIWSGARNSEYLDICSDCEDCFGCVGLKKKKHCILNKQYTKEEYETLRTQVVFDMKSRGEYGAFAPYNMGTCAYNRTTAALYMPEVTKEWVVSRGGYWDEVDLSQTDGASPDTLPDTVFDAPDDITKLALICPYTHFRFNIAPHELGFYKRFYIPLPETHPDYRIIERVKPTISTKTYPYSCDHCQKDIMAYYPPDLGYKHVLCVECYQQKIA